MRDVFWKFRKEKKPHVPFSPSTDRRQQREKFTYVLWRGPIAYYTISFDQHKNLYDFFNEQIVDDFSDVVYSRYEPKKEKNAGGMPK